MRYQRKNLGALGDFNFSTLFAASAPAPAPAPAPSSATTVAIAPSGAPVVATSPSGIAVSPASAAVAAALPASAPGTGPIAAPAPDAGIPTMPPVPGTGPASTAALPPTYWSGGAQEGREVQPTWDAYLNNLQWQYVQGMNVPLVQRTSAIAPKATFDNYFSASALQEATQRFLDYHPSHDFLDDVAQAFRPLAPIVAGGALAFMGAAAFAPAATAAAAAPEYLTAAEVAPALEYPAISESVITPTVAASLPEAAFATSFSAPALEFPAIPESVITPTTASEYLLPQEAMMPAAVPETPEALSEMGLTETAPGVFEAAPELTYPPISEEYITPTAPAGAPGMPSTWYAASPSSGAAAGSAPSAPEGTGAPGGSGGGSQPPNVPNAIKSALERLFTGKPALPLATHPQTLLEAAGEYAQANPVTGFALALAIGAGIVGARAIMKH